VTSLLSASALVAVLPGDSGDVRVLDGVSIALAPGEIIDIVGPSGSGKTTLLRALARLLPDATGALALDGISAETVSASKWRAAVALLPQKPAIVGGTVRDNLLLPWTLKVRRGVPQPDTTALEAAVDSVRLDVALDRDASRLSVGQSARVALLRVLLTRPRVLLLDEPDAALDEASAAAVGELTVRFAAEGGGVVRVRHHVADGLATRRLHLEGGTLADALVARVPAVRP
jgi:putative ABC transport system ATP-binding protein